MNWHTLVVIGWFLSSVVNWFFMVGYQNHLFKQNKKFGEPLTWIGLASFFSGYGGLISSIVVGRFKYFSILPLSKAKQEQIIMLWKLENSGEGYGQDMANNAQPQGGSTLGAVGIGTHTI